MVLPSQLTSFQGGGEGHSSLSDSLGFEHLVSVEVDRDVGLSISSRLLADLFTRSDATYI